MITSKQKNQSTFLMLQQIAQKSLDEALIRLKQTEDIRVAAQQQLTMLNGYYEEYQQQLTQALRNGINKELLSNFQHFMTTVEKSIEQQKHLVSTLVAKKNTALRAVNQWKKKVNAYSRLLEKQQKIVIQQENKLQQKQIDEFAQQHSARKLAYEHDRH